MALNLLMKGRVYAAGVFCQIVPEARVIEGEETALKIQISRGCEMWDVCTQSATTVDAPLCAVIEQAPTWLLTTCRDLRLSQRLIEERRYRPLAAEDRHIKRHLHI